MKKIANWDKNFFENKFKVEDMWFFFSSEYERKKYLRQVNIINDLVTQPKNILEIGCAEGAHTQILMHTFPTAHITAVDISENAIKRAKSNSPSSEGVNYFVADITEFISELPTDHYDIIFWSESIYYIGTQLSVCEMFDFMCEINKRLCKSGLLCMAHAIDEACEDEAFITKRAIMECYFQLLSDVCKAVHKSSYFEYKKEDGHDYEYQIWLFQKKIENHIENGK